MHLRTWIKMPARVATRAEQMPRQARYIVPRGLPRRGEFLAACLVLAVVAHVLFAQLTIVVAVVFVLVTRVTRWRLSWLRPRPSSGWPGRRRWARGPPRPASPTARPRCRLPRGQRAPGAHLLHFTAAFTGIGGWLPRQLPLAILTGTAEAAIIGWLSWLHTDERTCRRPAPACWRRPGAPRSGGPSGPAAS